MNPSEHQQGDPAIRKLDSVGCDERDLRRQMSELSLENTSQHAPSQTTEGLPLVSSDPLLSLRRFGASLTKETERIARDIEILKEERQRHRHLSAERKAISQKILGLESQLSSAKLERHAVLAETKTIAKKARIEESARVYDAMRVSKLGRRGERHIPD